jgi:hypothetical protein
MISRKAFQVTEIPKMPPVAVGASKEHICDTPAVGSGAAGLAALGFSILANAAKSPIAGRCSAGTDRYAS